MRPSRFVLFALIGMLAIASPARAGETRPNILVILADDLGFSDLGCYGGEIPTPNIDRLAGEGVRFRSFYSSARCCPSRASLMTGLHPHQARIGSFATRRPEARKGPAYLGHLADNCVTMGEVLKTRGYSTWMVGKWHMSLPGPIRRGFDEFYGYTDDHSHDQWDPKFYERLPKSRTPEKSWAEGEFHATRAFNSYALEFLKQARDQKKPWFLYVAHSSPHFPLHATPAEIDKHVDTYRKGWDVLRAERLARQKKLGLFPESTQLPPHSMVPVDRDDIANGYSGQPNPDWDQLPPERREDLARRMATFAAMVEQVDQGVGELLANLAANKELENTLIVFLSDNGACYEWGPFGFDGVSRQGLNILHQGEDLKKIGQPGTHQSYGSAWAELGNTPLKLYKHFCHEGGISVPCVVRWPGGIRKEREGHWSDVPGHLMDVLPTVCAATGATYPETFNNKSIQPVEGISLIPALNCEPVPDRILGLEHQQARGLRLGKWKVVWGKKMPDAPTWELYDLSTDRLEQHDLSSQYPDLQAFLAERWFDWAEKVKVFPFFKPEAEVSQTAQ